jgi:monoamine oxidase
MRDIFEDELEAKPQRDACLKRLKSTSVAVVGGGLAGLIAARRLGQLGIKKVTLFEARKQVGGRVLSTPNFSSGRITEEGAELIGSFHTRWLALAQEYGMTVISRMDGDLYEKAGLNVRLALDKLLSREEIRQLDSDLEKVLTLIANKATEITDPSQPWLQPSLQVYDRTSVAVALTDALTRLGFPTRGRLWMALEFLLVNNEVAPLDKMNYLGLLCKVKAGQKPAPGRSDINLMGYWNELEIFRCSEGCQKLATEIANEARVKYGARILSGTAVTHIDLSRKGARLGFKRVLRPDGTVAPGAPTIFNADYVVLTVPPTVWDRITITAEGKSAQPEVEIGQLGMGPAVKFFSFFNKRFWIKNKSAPFGGSSSIGQVWEGTDNQTKLDHQEVVLSVFAGPILKSPRGPRAPTRDEFKNGLNQLYPGYAGSLVNTLFTDWPNIPFIKTGYASPTIGQIFRIRDKLLKPFHGRLFFAGEHTQMDFFGYMEGALRSGERAAEKVCEQVCPMRVCRVA